MRFEDFMRQQEETRSYCAGLTDAQLENVARDEKRRAINHKDSDVGLAAGIFLASARAEIEARQRLRRS